MQSDQQPIPTPYPMLVNPWGCTLVQLWWYKLYEMELFFFSQPDAMNMIPAQMQIPGLDMSANLHNSATEMLCLMNMVEIEELMDDEEYEGNNCDQKLISPRISNRLSTEQVLRIMKSGNKRMWC